MDESEFRYKEVKRMDAPANACPACKDLPPIDNPCLDDWHQPAEYWRTRALRAEAEVKTLSRPEAAKYQILAVIRGQPGNHYLTVGYANQDLAATEKAAQDFLAQTHDASEVFVANLHAAYTKEVTLKKEF